MLAVEKNESNMKKCTCPECPSYNDCAKEKMEGLYCSAAVGRSSCEFQMNGCICGGCSVHTENSLSAGYYCLNG